MLLGQTFAGLPPPRHYRYYRQVFDGHVNFKKTSGENFVTWNRLMLIFARLLFSNSGVFLLSFLFSSGSYTFSCQHSSLKTLSYWLFPNQASDSRFFNLTWSCFMGFFIYRLTMFLRVKLSQCHVTECHKTGSLLTKAVFQGEDKELQTPQLVPISSVPVPSSIELLECHSYEDQEGRE